MRSLILLVALAPLGSAAVYQAPDPTPTPEETLILELMNRFRADPVAECDRLLAFREQSWSPDGVDWAMFEKEVKALEPAPPLVFDLDALESARWHSHYMILNGLGHVEDQAKDGFTAKSFGGRMKKAGFTGSPAGENCYRDAKGPMYSHFGFIVDWGKGGPGGMQPGRGHRHNMAKASTRVVGPGAVAHGGKLSVTHNFGKGGGRKAGGVVYVDRNGNDFYDVGEGRGGVTIRSADGKHRTTTWDSGAYVLPIGSSQGGLVAEWNGLKYAEGVPAGSDNVKFDWIIPQQADLDLADRLIEAAESASERKQREARVALLIRSAPLGLDPDRRSRIDQLTADIASEFDQAKTAVFGAIDGGERGAIRDALRDGGKAFRGTLAEDWFDQAEILAKASDGVAGYEAGVAAGKQPDADAVAKLREALAAAREQAGFEDLEAAYDALLARVGG